MTETPEVLVTVTRYEVSLLPEGHRARCHFTITVEHRGGASWAVLDGPFCLGLDGDWEYEPLPSNRTDEWISTHRFDLKTALELAKQAAPRVTVNGCTAAEVYHRTRT
ncbi:hypothetical protein AB0M57_04440 [Streptomyces sp. NPDC051597]|uniref:hypothetical protein n=1 Tax=Streptomyces sp. NPDC051597 TaxID=3155049 RepID=UPI003426827E